jgi:hypothetical protein
MPSGMILLGYTSEKNNSFTFYQVPRTLPVFLLHFFGESRSGVRGR